LLTSQKKLIDERTDGAKSGMKHLFGNFIRKLKRRSQRLIVILEQGNIVEVVLGDEVVKKLNIFLRFSREADDKIRANEMSGKICFDEVEELVNRLFIVKSAHSLQDGRRNVLERDIEVGDKFFEGGQLF
jgi:hypothetical protein